MHKSYEFNLPDYSGKSIVNLMSSIAKALGKTHTYPSNPDIEKEGLANYNNIVLLVVDGLGYNYLKSHKNSFLSKHLRGSLTSVFTPTTACANTVFATGYPPQQTGINSLYMNLSETGVLSHILKFKPYIGGASFLERKIKPSDVVNTDSFYKDLNGASFLVVEDRLAKMPLNNYFFRDANVCTTVDSDLKNIFDTITTIILKGSAKRRFIHAYIPQFDHLSHKSGTSSVPVETLFNQLDQQIEQTVAALKATPTIFIVTADHGFIDTPEANAVKLASIPGLAECLRLPLAGEARVRDCFVHPEKIKEFQKIVKEHLSDKCWIFKREELLKAGFYGLGKANPKLLERIGDFVLIMKGDFTLTSNIERLEPKEFSLGRHGGMSDDELFVPLVIIR